MGQVPLDLPDPLQAQPLANASGADDLLSQMAGDEIERLLAQADVAAEEPEADDAAAAAPVPAAPVPETAPVEAPRETAVSSFISNGDPLLEAELDNLLTNPNGAPVVLNDSGIVVPPGTKSETSGTDSAKADAPNEPPAPADASATAKEGSSTTSAEAKVDPVVTGELDQVFNEMTASAETASNDADKPAGSIDVLKVLDPIVAQDAAKAAEDEARGSAPAGEAQDDEESLPEGRTPIYVTVLEWMNAPLAWLPQPVRDAAGKIGIMTMINAAAVLLFVLFFRKHHR